MTIGETVRSYLCLCKAKISVFASLSAAVGFSLAAHSAGTTWTVLILGVFLMACGACSLNQYQERESDALMERTATRPLPAGKIKPGDALCISMALIGSGAGLLFFTGSLSAFLLGLGAVAWYNGFYTRSKARHAFAVLPGALVGALPPAIGWLAGGGSIAAPPVAVLCFFFFMWQIAHFFIHQLVFGKEYEAIDRPSLTAVFSGPQLDRLSFQWLVAAAVSLQLVIFQGVVRSHLVQIALFMASLWLVVEGTRLLKKSKPGYPGIFRMINHVMLAVMVLFLLDRLARYHG